MGFWKRWGVIIVLQFLTACQCHSNRSYSVRHVWLRVPEANNTEPRAVPSLPGRACNGYHLPSQTHQIPSLQNPEDDTSKVLTYFTKKSGTQWHKLPLTQMQYDITILVPVHCLKKKNDSYILCVYIINSIRRAKSSRKGLIDYAKLQGLTFLSTWALSNSPGTMD